MVGVRERVFFPCQCFLTVRREQKDSYSKGEKRRMTGAVVTLSEDVPSTIHPRSKAFFSA